MSLLRTRAAEPFALSRGERARLRSRLEEAARRARDTGGGVLAAHTVESGRDVDPSAVVFASRRPGEPWFAWEQPERDSCALATLGEVVAITRSGEERFTAAARAWRELLTGAVADPPSGPRGAGLVATAGFSFAPDGGSAPHWAGFASGSLSVPEVSLARRGGDVQLTVAALVQPDDLADDVLARLEKRLAELRDVPLPMLDPDPVGDARVVGAMPPEHYESAVARGVEQIRLGRFEKIVLAREVQVHASQSHDPAAVFGVLRDAFPGCFVFCAGRGSRAFLAASPELLIRREGLRASTVALAGSIGRSADPAVDVHMGERLMRSDKDREEQAIVARRIERVLKPRSVWLAAAPEPVIVQIANIQHLATPVRAQLRAPVSTIELAGLLHPTPAVGGEPHDLACPMIPALEGMDRGWYAGAIGWTDANEDGELCVGLRCALLDGAVARCYAGVGVVRDSDPAAELAETEVKLQALLPVLAA
jgi:isochorismate synthase